MLDIGKVLCFLLSHDTFTTALGDEYYYIRFNRKQTQNFLSYLSDATLLVRSNSVLPDSKAHVLLWVGNKQLVIYQATTM